MVNLTVTLGGNDLTVKYWISLQQSSLVVKSMNSGPLQWSLSPGSAFRGPSDFEQDP